MEENSVETVNKDAEIPHENIQIFFAEIIIFIIIKMQVSFYLQNNIYRKSF